MPKSFHFILKLLSFLILVTSFFIHSSSVLAADKRCNGILLTTKDNRREFDINQPIEAEISISSDVLNLLPIQDTYHLRIHFTKEASDFYFPLKDIPTNGAKKTYVIDSDGLKTPGTYTLRFIHSDNKIIRPFTDYFECDGTSFTVKEKVLQDVKCTLDIPKNIKLGSTATAQAKVFPQDASKVRYRLVFYKDVKTPQQFAYQRGHLLRGQGNELRSEVFAGTPTVPIPDKVTNTQAQWTAALLAYIPPEGYTSWGACQVVNFTVGTQDTTKESAEAKIAPGISTTITGIRGEPSSAAGISCPESTNGILTAIGCVPTEPRAFVEGVLKLGAGAGGGIAFIMMIAGIIQIIASRGNSEALKKGQEQTSAAVIGLLFIIFSILLLRIIGVDLLGILPK